MSSIRRVFWRGGLALAMLPISMGLVAANAPATVETETAWKLEFAHSAQSELRQRMHEQEASIARQVAAAQVQELRVAVAIARAQQQEAVGKTVIRIVRERPAQPSG